MEPDPLSVVVQGGAVALAGISLFIIHKLVLVLTNHLTRVVAQLEKISVILDVLVNRGHRN